METKNGELGVYQEEKDPPFIFTILGKEVNLADAFSTDAQKRREATTYTSEPEQEAPEEKAAAKLLWALESSGVTFDEYKKAMPQLFAYAQNKEGKFDVGLIGVIFNTFDRTAEEMQVGRSAKVVSHGVDEQGRQITRAGWRGQLHETDRTIFFARSFGFIKGVREGILNIPDPGLADRQKKVMDFGLNSPWLRDVRASAPPSLTQ